MKILLTIIILILTYTTKLQAETWSCIYSFNNESRTMEVTRVGRNHFSRIYDGKVSNFKIEIVNETRDFIHLYNNVGDDKMAFLRVLDKKNSSFVMVGLEYQDSTDIIEGKCIVK